MGTWDRIPALAKVFSSTSYVKKFNVGHLALFNKLLLFTHEVPIQEGLAEWNIYVLPH